MSTSTIDGQNIYNSFVCECDEFKRSACKGFGFYKEKEGKQYCVLHYPDKEKAKYFKVALQKKLDNKDFNFLGVWFPDVVAFREFEFADVANFNWATFNASTNFSSAKFDAYVYFSFATFNADVFFESATFSAGAYFSSATFNAYAGFNSAMFSADVNFSSATFNKNAYAYFDRAMFRADANFNSATFSSNTDFRFATFSTEANFRSATFNAYAYFRSATFSANAIFDFAIFDSTVDFTEAAFKENKTAPFYERRFYNTKFKDKVVFAKNTLDESSRLSFDGAIFEKPERVTFHTVSLRPHWFVNVDTRKFNFVDVWGNFLDKHNVLQQALNALSERSVRNRHQLLSITFRQLAVNAEENNRYEEASNFRRMALLTEWDEKKEWFWHWIDNHVDRTEKLKSSFGGPPKEKDEPNLLKNAFDLIRRGGDFILHGLYRITSDYGESWSWAAIVLLIFIFAIFPSIYTRTNFQTCPKEKPLAMSLAVCESKPKDCECRKGGLSFGEAIAHSFTTATLQSVDYRKPTTISGEIWIILEKIFAPLQTALLFLAIRRKFMR